MVKKKGALPSLVLGLMTEEASSMGAVTGLSNRCQVQVAGRSFSVAVDELSLLSNLGEGQFGTVDKMKHIQTGFIFAVKKIRCSMDQKEQSRLLNDIDISMRGSQCPTLVVSYGAIFHGGDVWICMEVMDVSLDKFYCQIPENDFIDEILLAYITFGIVTALEYLHKEMKVIHRDVKPSNMLLDLGGRVKICDFGISGYLVNSLAKTNVGSQRYLSPERISPDRGGKEYGIKSDVWSLGLSVLEVALKRFPYKRWSSVLDQLQDVVHSKTSPSLPEQLPYSSTSRHFISQCLQFKVSDRAKYNDLLKDRWLRPFSNKDFCASTKIRLAKFVSEVLDLSAPPSSYNSQ